MINLHFPEGSVEAMRLLRYPPPHLPLIRERLRRGRRPGGAGLQFSLRRGRIGIAGSATSERPICRGPSPDQHPVRLSVTWIQSGVECGTIALLIEKGGRREGEYLRERMGAAPSPL